MVNKISCPNGITGRKRQDMMYWYRISKESVINLCKVSEVTTNKGARQILFLDGKGNVIDTENVPDTEDFEEYYDDLVAWMIDAH